jgi:hypothetical protein
VLFAFNEFAVQGVAACVPDLVLRAFIPLGRHLFLEVDNTADVEVVPGWNLLV